MLNDRQRPAQSEGPPSGLKPWNLSNLTSVTWWVKKAARAWNGMKRNGAVFHIISCYLDHCGFWFFSFTFLIVFTTNLAQKLIDLNILQTLALPSAQKKFNYENQYTCFDKNSITEHKWRYNLMNTFLYIINWFHVFLLPYYFSLSLAALPPCILTALFNLFFFAFKLALWYSGV